MSRRARDEDHEPDWGRIAVKALAVVVVALVALGIWAIGEGKMTCGGGGQNTSAACFPPDANDDE